MYAPGNSTIGSFVNWGSEGYSSTLLFGQYWNTTSVNGVNFPAYSLVTTAAPSASRQPPSFFKYFGYSGYGPGTQITISQQIVTGSITTYPGFSGVIGGTANYNGTLPPVPSAANAPMPSGGGFIGYNAEAGSPGEADWFSTVPGVKSNSDGHAFWVVNSGVWSQVGGFTRGGRVYAPHGMRVQATGSTIIVDGFTGTCAPGTTLTVVGGVITGCS